MAQGAVLRGRRVLPQKRTAFVLVAAEAIVVECGLVQVRVTQTAVRVMAVGAASFALSDGMARR